jgi:hypothetical protein
MNYSELKNYELYAKLDTAARLISRYMSKKPEIATKWMNIQSEVRAELASRKKPCTGSFLKAA